MHFLHALIQSRENKRVRESEWEGERVGRVVHSLLQRKRKSKGETERGNMWRDKFVLSCTHYRDQETRGSRGRVMCDVLHL